MYECMYGQIIHLELRLTAVNHRIFSGKNVHENICARFASAQFTIIIYTYVS